MNKINSIYIIKNLINNKVYIGQTWRLITVRFNEHLKDKRGMCVKLFNAINKYGKENFFIEEIACSTSQENANYLENYFINMYDSMCNGYNLTSGGANGLLSEETKLKMSLSKLNDKNSFYGKTHSLKAKEMISQANTGRIKSKETIEKLRISSTGRVHSENSKNKISEGNKGKIRSEESKTLISLANSGINNGNYGKPMSEEAKQKLRNTRIINNAKKKLAKQMQQFYQSTIYYNLDM